MEFLERFFLVVPIPVLILIMFGAIVLPIVVPARLRLPIGIFLLPIWLTFSQARELGAINLATTATAGLLYVFIGIAAVLDIREKRAVPLILWLYPALGVFSAIFFATTVDWVHAMAVQIQWILLATSTILVMHTIVDSQSLFRIIKPLTIGIAVALLIPLSDVILTGEAAIRRVGRFFPWGANPNQMGLLFSLAVPLGVYFAITTQHLLMRVLYGTMAAAAFAMILLTASRGVTAVALLPLVPLLWALVRRPIVATVILATGVIAVTFLLRDFATIDTERLMDPHSGRWATFAEYVDVILDRPLTGLLGTTGQYFITDPTLDKHMHNAYLYILYQGGILFFIPYLFLLVYTMYCALRLWKNRSLLPHDPLFTTMLIFSVFAIYAHGFVNMSIYYSTYLWAFWHLLISCLMISWARDVKYLSFAELSSDETGTGEEYERCGTPELAFDSRYSE